jgi:hypothetical protein
LSGSPSSNTDLSFFIAHLGIGSHKVFINFPYTGTREKLTTATTWDRKYMFINETKP